MRFLRRLFREREPVEQAQKLDIAMTSCQFESSNNDCSLIQQLKDKQEKKREVDGKITSFEMYEPVVLEKFMEFLFKLERDGFEMGTEFRSHHTPSAYGSKIKDTFTISYGVQRFQGVIDQTTEADIDAIYTELKTIKNRVNILRGLHRESSALSDEIKKIKSQLGIE